MAVTVAVVDRVVRGGERIVYVDVTGPASYTTAGETLTAAQQATLMPEDGVPVAAVFSRAVFFESEVDVSGRKLALDRTNQKMLFFAAGAEVTSATNLSAVTIRCAITYSVNPIA